MFENLFVNMFVNGVWFGGGLVVSTVVWFFVLRNNKKNFAAWMSGTEEYFQNVLVNMDDVGENAAAKIDEFFANMKK